MGAPQPKFPLTGHCSVIHDGTLYVYSPAGFQSIKLQEGAQWEALPMDVSLTGAKCVKAVPGGNAANAMLYIVGGSVNETAATWNYPGLMHYTFSQKKWDWLRPESWNTQNRQNHGAVYLQDSQKLLVYAGSQTTGDAGPSSQTFLISTQPPYNVQSMPSAGAPPSVSPLLMSMDTNAAVLVGGSAANTAVWSFDEAGGWRNMGATLQQPITNQDAVQCAVVSSTGKSKVLQKFDLSVSPNKVENILLTNEDGSPATVGATVGGKVKRVTVSNWPQYNATLAPTSTRTGYSLAQADNGLTVGTGGNSADPMVIFDTSKNSWVNATAMFAGQQVIQQSISSSSIVSAQTSATPTASSIASPSASPTDSADTPLTPPDNKGKMLTVLGATLGTIFGIAAVLILILLCLKYRKSKVKANQGYVEKDRMSFADRGADFMKEAGGSVVSYNYSAKNDSQSSLAIIQGRGVGHKKNMASDASVAGLVKKTSPLGYSDPVEMSKFDLKPEPVNEKVVRQNSSRKPPMEKPASTRPRSSGWSRYFANNVATNLASTQPARGTYTSDTSMTSHSQYTDMHGMQHPSQQIAPLEIPKLDGQRLSRVASGSPTLGSSIRTLPHQVQPMQAELGRADSNSSSRSGLSYDGEHFGRKPVESWSPVRDDRPASSNYGDGYDGVSSYYGPESGYPKSTMGSSFYPSQSQADVGRDSTNTMFPSSNAPLAGASSGPVSNFSSIYPAPPRLGETQDRGSTVTIFPGPNAPTNTVNAPKIDEQGSFYPPPRVNHDSTVTIFPGGNGKDSSKNTQSDMSWLNLGASR